MSENEPSSGPPDWWRNGTSHDQFLGTCVSGLGSMLGGQAVLAPVGERMGGERPKTKATVTAITKDLSRILQGNGKMDLLWREPIQDRC